MLGERYGIPTEFTSYLVTEPQFSRNAALGAGGRAGGTMPTAAPALTRHALRVGEGRVGAAGGRAPWPRWIL